jgi:hypothetical protein
MLVLKEAAAQQDAKACQVWPSIQEPKEFKACKAHKVFRVIKDWQDRLPIQEPKEQ